MASGTQVEVVSTASQTRPGRLRLIWNGLSAAVGAVMGLLPHVLHHVGFLAGTFLLTGVAGNLAFGAAGLALSVPFLLRLRRRFGTWRAPALALALFGAAFSLSTFVIGPAITGDGASVSTPDPAPTQDHDVHHEP